MAPVPFVIDLQVVVSLNMFLKTVRKYIQTDKTYHTYSRLCESYRDEFGFPRQLMIENSGRSLDSVYVEMNVSIDYMIDNLVRDDRKFNEITGYLFNLLEQRSLYETSEYLALKVLNEVSCTIDNNLAAQLESYRAMKVGNTAPDFTFKEDVLMTGYQGIKSPQKLSDIKASTP